jgi:hypothetical protein
MCQQHIIPCYWVGLLLTHRFSEGLSKDTIFYLRMSVSRPPTLCVHDVSHSFHFHRSPVFILSCGSSRGWRHQWRECVCRVFVRDCCGWPCWNLILTCTFQMPLINIAPVVLNKLLSTREGLKWYLFHLWSVLICSVFCSLLLDILDRASAFFLIETSLSVILCCNVSGLITSSVKLFFIRWNSCTLIRSNYDWISWALSEPDSSSDILWGNTSVICSYMFNDFPQPFQTNTGVVP